MTRTARFGFTLIELLIVIAVMGVIATIVLVAVNPAAQFAKLRNSQRKNDMRQIVNALERYKVIAGTYPVSPIGTWCDTANNGYFLCSPNPLQKLVDSGDLKKLPIEPRDGESWPHPAVPSCEDAGAIGYLYYSDGVNYKVLDYCGPEGNAFSASDPFVDPPRPTSSWSIYTPGGSGW